jgi:hypothetical protein
MPTIKPRGASFVFCSTIFVSAFLIFQVQPLISKFILPWFGGTPGVWSACMLFFQTVLFAGYAYAHFSIRRFQPRTQGIVHLGLLILAACCLPIAPSADWKPQGHEEPIWRILSLLAMNVGLPYFVLSSTGPLMQAWFSRTQPAVSPYRLYALSNLGSVLGLVSYPFLFEPLWTTQVQSQAWSLAFIVFGVLCGCCALQAVRVAYASVSEKIEETATATADQSLRPTRQDQSLWFGLSGCASTMLLATTNQVCLDVAVIPFLWVLPLSLYLLSFILVFESDQWYPRGIYTIAMVTSVTLVTLTTYQAASWPILPQLVIYFATLFFVCMVCHGELVRLKPAPRFLTSFYLATAAGGAAGGIFVGLLAPVIFERLIEFQFGLIACCACLLKAHRRQQTMESTGGKIMWVWTGLAICMLGLFRMWNPAEGSQTELAVSRNFFGVLRILEMNADHPEQHYRTMIHGRTHHGHQYQAPAKRRLATTYYGEQSGVGLALKHWPRTGSMRGGFVGLGIGTLARYGRAGDSFRFYEIDPDVVRQAQDYFTYLSDSEAQVEVVLGDARLSLEREAPQQYDVLVLDAFSSDAIPVHLLTREAFAIYQRHLQPSGVLAIHISNRFFDLQPIVTRLGDELGLRSERFESNADETLGTYVSHWMLLSRNSEFWSQPEIQSAIMKPSDTPKTAPLWTDQFSNLIGILK